VTECGRHLLHMLRAHTQAYNAIKAMPGKGLGAYSSIAARRHQTLAVRNWSPLQELVRMPGAGCGGFYVWRHAVKLA
jgi:hypothetical protein